MNPERDSFCSILELPTATSALILIKRYPTTAGICDPRNGVQEASCKVAILGRLCPGWVKSGHSAIFGACPLYPQKRTLDQHDRDVCFVPKADILRCSEERRYSITSSACASRAAGIVRPIVLAVLRLTTSWYFVGACTGRSPGFSPFRIRSTYSAARRYSSIRSGP